MLPSHTPDRIFDQAVSRTLQFEGGYVDHPRDPGGATKYGISSRAYPDLDIASLSLADAVAIYRRDYWDKIGLHQLQDAQLACLLFDLAVLCGPGTAVLHLQRACNQLGLGRVKLDGQLGPATAAAVAQCRHPLALVALVKHAACGYFLRLNRPEFLAGWLKRLES